MYKAVNSHTSSDLPTKPKLSQLAFHIQEYTIPVNDSTNKSSCPYMKPNINIVP